MPGLNQLQTRKAQLIASGSALRAELRRDFLAAQAQLEPINKIASAIETGASWLRLATPILGWLAERKAPRALKFLSRAFAGIRVARQVWDGFQAARTAQHNGAEYSKSVDSMAKEG
jgi:hypothetical protein